MKNYTITTKKVPKTIEVDEKVYSVHLAEDDLRGLFDAHPTDEEGRDWLWVEMMEDYWKKPGTPHGLHSLYWALRDMADEAGLAKGLY